MFFQNWLHLRLKILVVTFVFGAFFLLSAHYQNEHQLEMLSQKIEAVSNNFYKMPTTVTYPNEDLLVLHDSIIQIQQRLLDQPSFIEFCQSPVWDSIFSTQLQYVREARTYDYDVISLTELNITYNERYKNFYPEVERILTSEDNANWNTSTKLQAAVVVSLAVTACYFYFNG